MSAETRPLVEYGRLPRLADLVRAAIAAFNDSAEACRHIVAGNMNMAVRLLCAQHAQVLRCWECMLDHAAEHDDTEEHRCDSCLEVDELISSMLIPTLVAGDVHTPRGRAVHICGLVAIGSLGLCRSCRRVLVGEAP
jgi:hypothetical protein